MLLGTLSVRGFFLSSFACTRMQLGRREKSKELIILRKKNKKPPETRIGSVVFRSSPQPSWKDQAGLWMGISIHVFLLLLLLLLILFHVSFVVHISMNNGSKIRRRHSHHSCIVNLTVPIMFFKRASTKELLSKQRKVLCRGNNHTPQEQEGILHAHAWIRWMTIAWAHQIWWREIENSRVKLQSF